MSPWLLAILYDFVLWVCRTIWYELPVFGGRAQGDQRPRAPSLRDRERRKSIVDMVNSAQNHPEPHDSTTPELRRRDHEKCHDKPALQEGARSPR